MHNSIPVLLKPDYTDEDADEGIVRQILRAARRRPGLAVTVFVLVMALAVAGLLVLRPKYTATTLVVVNATQNLLGAGDGQTGTLADSTRVDTEAEILRSDPVLLAAIRSQQLVDDADFQPGILRRLLVFSHLAPASMAEGGEVAALDRLHRAVSAQRRALTAVVAVNVSTFGAAKAAAIADAIADAYLQQQVQAKIAVLTSSRDTISAELGRASDEAARAERALAAFASANPTIAGSGDATSGAGTANGAPDASAETRDLRQRADLARAQYDALVRSIADLDTQIALQLPDSRMVARATIPTTPSFPQPIPFLILGVMGGIVGALAAAYIAERLQGGFADEWQLATAIKMPVAGALPMERGTDTRRFGEALSRLAGVVELALGRTRSGQLNRPPVILVCASQAREGASTVANGLAAEAGAKGRKVLLLSETVDTPTTATVLPAPWHAASAGEVPARINEAAQSFDLVVRDGLPVGSSADALAVSRAADIVVFVIDSRRTSRRAVRASLNALAAAKAPEAEIVIVLNRQRRVDGLYKRASA